MEKKRNSDCLDRINNNTLGKDMDTYNNDNSTNSSAEECTKRNPHKKQCQRCDQKMKEKDKFCWKCGYKYMMANDNNNNNDNERTDINSKIENLQSRNNEILGIISCQNNTINEKNININRKMFFPFRENPELLLSDYEYGSMWISVGFATPKDNISLITIESKILQISNLLAFNLGYHPKQLVSSPLSILKSNDFKTSQDLHLKKLVEKILLKGETLTVQTPSVFKHANGTLYGLIYEASVYPDITFKGRVLSFSVINHFWKLNSIEEAKELFLKSDIQIIED
eukprot:TRINITY_DN3945_c1_g1_i1.p1 TRINITY_DN3945_c1_g1~~TRINITY_DN3945_c1_g1_i1.p1  ORF type:complete len:284 (-),score=62.65 TRINITY_DN3945_c1_g1_i1:78-929(-)